MEITIKLDSAQLKLIEALVVGNIDRALKSHIRRYHKKEG